jgi:hypothetical protein
MDLTRLLFGFYFLGYDCMSTSDKDQNNFSQERGGGGVGERERERARERPGVFGTKFHKEGTKILAEYGNAPF